MIVTISFHVHVPVFTCFEPVQSCPLRDCRASPLLSQHGILSLICLRIQYLNNTLTYTLMEQSNHSRLHPRVLKLYAGTLIVMLSRLLIMTGYSDCRNVLKQVSSLPSTVLAQRFTPDTMG
ncbi:hypothetical protein NPIL_248871 [Nephila pilipes]|uniref:Uncharacterized protein n=1 Tax=Nephila pilipes TaxID=299642 RepID=A0A8X6QPM6_NEPPI|nr:hypothetical protein NPIL_248871 [Nephila pilipes]